MLVDTEPSVWSVPDGDWQAPGAGREPLGLGKLVDRRLGRLPVGHLAERREGRGIYLLTRR